MENVNMTGFDFKKNKDVYKGPLPEFISKTGTDISAGLDDGAVSERFKVFGLNILKEKKKRSVFQKILDQFKDFMVIILIIASAVSGALGEWIDALVIIAIVIINAILGVVQEGKAEKAIEALQKMSAPNAKVIRNGKLLIIPAREIVPGDVCVLEAGDIVPADIRLIESSSLKAEEASLTGESVPVEKTHSVDITHDVPLGDRVNMCFMSTAITYGHGKGIVIATGAYSEIGSIADRLQDIKDEPTPLQKNLNEMGKLLGIICLIVCVIVFVNGVIMGGVIIEVFLTAVSLAVAAIPEGLPAVVTIVLALGMKRMADKNAIMKQLLAVETLGSVDVICSDKTGTLTQNEMTVTRVWCDNEVYQLTGQGYNPAGEIRDSKGGTLEGIDPASPLYKLFHIAVLCNDAKLVKGEGDMYSIIGDPTEAAMVVGSEKVGISSETQMTIHPRKDDLPFDSERKMMTTFHEGVHEEGVVTSYTKGGPDIVLGNCDSMFTADGVIPLDDEMRRKIIESNKDLASQALRVLAFAFKEHSSDISFEAEKSMTFVGLMGMIDPERPEAKEAIELCNTAGIRAVMITGDYRETAVAIAKNLGLMKEGFGVMTGPELDSVSDEDLLTVVENTAVYARVSPDHKVRIVTALRQNGHIASMTGDGVNDAMALKRADIGVAMGITGTEVAKDTANMILTDDNFATIVAAVREGRIIYSNIRKFVGFLLSCNVGEILVIFITSMALGPKFTPLLPIQLLWLNLVTDSFPALALGREQGEDDIMKEKPRKSTDSIINRQMIMSIIVQSIAIFGAVFGAFQVARFIYPDIEALAGSGIFEPSPHARTFAFVTLILAELLRAFSCRSEHASVFSLGFFSNKFLTYAVLLSFVLVMLVVYIPFLQPVFSTNPLSAQDWLIVAGFALIPFAAGEIYKLILRMIRKK
ncbi:MAG: calcium-translocating P-type ATPase, SERCA-type [Saccharofermentanales bacterium]